VTFGLPISQQKGAQVFQYRGCRACHAIDGSGGHKGPDLTSIGNKMTQGQLTTQIASGGGGMPAYAGIISPAELNSLVTFLSSLQSPNKQPARTPPVP
jgi:ubiquinol-cytochrome c reductase cytochrome b subunit